MSTQPALPAVALTRAVDGPSASAMFAALQAHALAQGLEFRSSPADFTTCCGRGCNGCVWEGFADAAEYWRREALLVLGYE